MKINVNWPDGSMVVNAPEEGTLLEHLIVSGIPMPNSCRRGDCQQCACRITDGQFRDIRSNNVSSTEFHLACQIEPLSDIDVELPENPYVLLEKPRHITTKITDIKYLSLNVICLSLVFPRNQVFRFNPGQYIDIKLKSGVTRSYSIAAYDAEKRGLDLHIRIIEGGQLSFWLKTASIGDLIQIYGPSGRFFLREKIQANHTFMIATGTGIAPIFCMLSKVEPEALKRLGKITLLWGNRHHADNYLDDSLSRLASDINADYFTVYSAEKITSRKGRVTDFIPDSFFESQVFAAGNPHMISELRALAYKRELPYASFYADAFSFSSLSDGASLP